jgi:FHA domain
MICTRCRAPNAADATCCENCGYDLTPSAKPKTVAESAPDGGIYQPAQNAKRRTVVEPGDAGAGGPFAASLEPPSAERSASLRSHDPFASAAAGAPPRAASAVPAKKATAVDVEHRPAPGRAAEAPASADRRIVGWLVTFDGRGNAHGKSFVLREGRNSIGRDPDRDVCCDDPMMSGAHACIQYRGGRVWVFDENSNNGTFVNGEDIFQEKLTLTDGVELRVGRTRFIVKLLDPGRVEAVFFASSE